MDYILLLFAFIFGLGFKFLNLPPLIGYLLAGFVLNAWGFENNDTLQAFADTGITIMLFTIGLKLNVKDLLKPEILVTSLSHTIIWVTSISAILVMLSVFGIPYFIDLSLTSSALIAFAFSFSSTVCVVKILEESGEMRTRHGKIAIGILVVQDILAVLFLVFATGKIPSIYALGLFALVPLAPLLKKLLSQSGHGELLPLTGLIMAFGGYHLFELGGVKGDLGALIFGVLLAGHAKSNELSKSLLSFKDLFLIGFFLTIGLTALPNLQMTLIALGFTLLLPIKFGLFFILFTQVRLRARTSYLASLIMNNYSEFGLIVGAVSVSIGLLADTWLVILAMSTSFSFVVTSLLYKKSHDHYNKHKEIIKRYSKDQPLPEDIYPTLTNAQVLVVGMGRVQKLQRNDFNAIVGDGENIDLWENLDIQHVKLVMLALPSIEDSSNITNQLRAAGYEGKIAAIARYEDEVEPLMEKGVDRVFNFFTEAGLGFAEESLEMIDAINTAETSAKLKA